MHIGQKCIGLKTCDEYLDFYVKILIKLIPLANKTLKLRSQ